VSSNKSTGLLLSTFHTLAFGYFAREPRA